MEDFRSKLDGKKSDCRVIGGVYDQSDYKELLEQKVEGIETRFTGGRNRYEREEVDRRWVESPNPSLGYSVND